MIVISDTAPIIFFGKINKLSILKELYQIIYLPTEVWEELIYPLKQNHNDIPEDIKLELEAKDAGWLIVKNPEKEESIELALKLSQQLGLGEAYAIALSNELNADLLLINDRKARDIATELGITTKWTTEVLIDAVSEKIISSFDDFKRIVNTMIKNGLWIEKNFYNKLLEKVKKKFNI
ncbi:MAG: hypothetical protein ACFFC3_12230 [Candidatus Odinarchaeota archaeon]